MARSNENYLRWKFGKWITNGYTPNVSIVKMGDDASITPEHGEAIIGQITLNSGPEPLWLTDKRLVRAGKTLVSFEDVVQCIWIDGDTETAIKLKSEKFDRVILELRDGQDVVIEGMRQAVFPLMSFFRNKLGVGYGRVK